jgi:hypothetical protein
MSRGQLGNQVLIFPFILIIVIVCVSIAVGAGMFYGSGYDTREHDADMLAGSIMRCLKDNEIEWGDDLESNADLLFATCRINRNVTEEHFRIEIVEGEKLVYGNRWNALLCTYSDNNELPKCAGDYEEIDGVVSMRVSVGSEQEIRRKLDG